MKITVLDAAPGSGKTTRLIEMMASYPASKKIVYVTPLLSECHRIAGTLPSDPKNDDMSPLLIDDDDYAYVTNNILRSKLFRHPITKRSKHGTKLNDFKNLVADGCNIVSTHALFTLITPEICEYIKDREYVLILDEVLTMYDTYDSISKDMLQRCFSNKWMYVDEDNITLRWNHECGEYEDIINLDEIGRLCDNGQLLLVDGKVVVVEFPFHVLEAFSEIYIATYMFEGSQMYPYLKSCGADMNIVKFGKNPSEYKHLIEIVSDKKMNRVGDDYYSLSMKYYKNPSNKLTLNQMASLMDRFFRTCNQTKKEERLWTTYKSHSGILSKGRYAKNWIPCNTKATNDYGNTWAVAYMMNLFPNPMIVKILSYKDASIDETKYAISELVQFIWRSRIRKGEPIKLYIPSCRMRALLEAWLNDEFL